MMLTADRLRDLVFYDRDTGAFVWRTRRHRVHPGKTAGSLGKKGYVNIVIEGKSYKAGRLAWLYMTGDWPKREVDHKDRNPSNNRWSNLREATPGQNSANKGSYRNNTSGFKGVARQAGKWTAYAYKDGVRYYLGLFDNIDDAVRARRQKTTELHGVFSSD